MGNINIKRFIQIGLLALLITCSLFTTVNALSYALIPDKEVKITVLEREAGERGGNEVWIIKNPIRPDTDTFFNCLEGSRQGKWILKEVVYGEEAKSYRDIEDSSLVADAMVSYGNDNPGSVSFKCPLAPEYSIQFRKMENGGKILVEAGGNSEIVDLFTEADKNEYRDAYVSKYEKKSKDYINVYPFKDSKMSFGIKMISYALLYFFMYIVLYYVIGIIENKNISPILLKKVSFKLFIIGFLGIYIYSVIAYLIGIPNFLAFGDQTYYWNLINDMDKEKPFFEAFAEDIVSFRGYICTLVPYIAQKIGVFLRINPVYIYFISTAFFASLLIFYSLPNLYELTTGKKADIFKCLLFLLIYFYFFGGTITAVLMDMPAVSSFFTGIVFILKYAKSQKKKYIIVSGIFMALACLYRSSYKHFVLGAVIVAVVALVINKFSKKANQAAPKHTLKKLAAVTILWVTAFVVMCVPQIILNSYNGHIGLLPYDYKGSWLENYTLAENSASGSFERFSYWPYPIKSDEQVRHIKDDFYDIDEDLNMNQIMNVFLENPADTLTFIGKKIVAGFDVRTRVAYPLTGMREFSTFYIMGLLNYFILFSGLYALGKFDTGKINKPLLALIFAFLILPQTLVHIEWRYFLPCYVMIYYLFAYYFADIIADKDIAKKVFGGNYLFYAVLFMFSMQWLSTTFYGI